MMRYWVIQQGFNWFTVASVEQPDLNVPAGERRKALHGFWPTAAEATGKAQELASFYNGVYLPTAP